MNFALQSFELQLHNSLLARDFDDVYTSRYFDWTIYIFHSNYAIELLQIHVSFPVYTSI